MRGLSHLQNWIFHLSTYLSVVPANDVMERYVMEHFLFPGNIEMPPMTTAHSVMLYS